MIAILGANESSKISSSVENNFPGATPMANEKNSSEDFHKNSTLY